MNLNQKSYTSKLSIDELKKEIMLKFKKNIDEIVARNKKAGLEIEKSKNKTENSICHEIVVNSHFKHNWDNFNTLTQNQKAVLEAIQNVKDRCRY